MIKMQFLLNDLVEADLKEGESIAEDEVHGSFDVAVLVVMPAEVIVERVLRPQKLASHEGGVVSRYPQRHRLLPSRPWSWNRGGVLCEHKRTRVIGLGAGTGELSSSALLTLKVMFLAMK